MKLTIDKNILQKSLSHIQGVVEKRNSVPILSNLKITLDEATPNKINITATDMDIAISEDLEAITEGAGAITVPAHTLHDIVRKLPDGCDVVMKYDVNSTNQKLKVTAKKSNFTLPILPASDYPEIDIQNVSHKFTVNRKSFVKLLDKARFAISTEETRYYLNGIYLHQATANDSRQVLRAVATDGHRLASIQTDLPEGASGMPSVIIPRKTVMEIRKILEEEQNDLEVTIEVSEAKIKVSFSDITLISKLIDGSFPDYERVIPKNNTKVLTTDLKPLTQAIDRVSTITSDKSKSIKFLLENDNITISANDLDHGFAKEEIDTEYKDTRVETGFNSKYLLEMTSVIDGNQIRMHFSDSSSPTLVEDLEDQDSLYVIMPMRV
ncbi:MAG: DNA polymerase III subunit beta [Rickettsiales bacterium]|jgi:DNA polymerase III subunit beta|nr:DNA polymerase III subunit beta [Rickettsiales bacterium]